MNRSLTTLRATVAVLALLAAPCAAEAYALSCGAAVDAILNGSDGQAGVAVGHSVGVVDFLAGLHCFTGHRACSCLANLVVSSTDAFSEALAARLASCAALRPFDPAFGPAVQAAADLCGL
ncbi:MAG: hypothetical protein AB1689_20520 [Thermodesulfobacteriota bacterium]